LDAGNRTAAAGGSPTMSWNRTRVARNPASRVAAQTEMSHTGK
jgi:hypothetical protein